jgi:subtilase family serine protease
VFSHPKAVSNVDLVVSSLSAPSVVAPGQLITVNDTTKNQGSSAAEASQTAYYWSTNKTFEPTDTLLGGRAVPALAAGASSSSGVLSGNVTVPDKVANGSYYILAVADTADVVFESVESNNVRSKLVKVGPDLLVSKLTGPSKAAPGQVVTVTDTVKNQGSTTAASSFTRFYWSLNSSFGTGDILLGERSVSSLAAGVSNVGAGTQLTIPAGVANGTYYIVAVADGRGTVSVTTETNNGRGLKVGINPDLAITAFTAPTAAARGSTILVSDTTSNIGPVAAGASTTRFYLSTNSSFDATTDTLLTSRAVGTLGAGASSSGNVAITIPSGGGAGTFYLIAVADGDKVLTELSETNNTKAKSIFLSVAL